MDDIPQTLPMKKSGTHSFALPSISKTQSKIPTYKTARANTTRHHSVFIDKIKNLTKDVKYEEMQTNKITEQQKQLKGLLREFNQETYHILNRYIDRPVDMQSSKKPRATSTSMMELKDKEISNSNDALQICKREMELLEKKCENLKYVTVQDFERKIDSLKIEIQQLRNSNKEIIKGNTLRGLQIKRGDAKVSHEVSEIEQQKFILEKKKDRLTEDLKFVNEQQQKLKQSHNKADEDIKKMSQEFNKYEKENKDSKGQKELIKTYEQKKREFESRKEKISGKIENEIVVTQSEDKIQEKALGVLLQKEMGKEKPKQEQGNEKLKIEKTNKQKQGSTQIENKKGKKEVVKPNTNRYQYQYLKLLKDLDEVTKRLKGQDEGIKQFTSKIESSKKQVLEYEQKLLSVKKPTQPLANTSQINDKNKQDGQEKKDDGNKKWSFF